MSVVLINAAPRDQRCEPQRSPNLALGYLASALLEAGYDAHTIDLMYDPLSPDDVLDQIDEWEARLIGVSTLTPGYPLAVRLARRIRARHPDIPIVVGGPHVTYLDREALRSGAFDVVVRHEGDRTLVEVARFYLDGVGTLGDILGISFRAGSANRRTPDSKPIADLDSLPLPARHLAPLEHYRSCSDLRASVITSRGCLYHCRFCNSHRFNHGCRLRSVGGCLDEISALEPLGFESVAFVDGNLFASRTRTERFLGRLEDLRWTWTANVTVQPWIDRPLLELARTAGCVGLLVGLESGSDVILEAIGRPNRVADVFRFVEDACAAGIQVTVGLMVGHPCDTLETLTETVQAGRRLHDLGGRVTCAYNSPYPGTYQYDHAAKLGLRNIVPDWTRYDLAHPVMETSNLTFDDQRAAVSRIAHIAGAADSPILAWVARRFR